MNENLEVSTIATATPSAPNLVSEYLNQNGPSPKQKRQRREITTQEQKLRDENKMLKKELDIARTEIEELYSKANQAKAFIAEQEKDIKTFYDGKQASDKRLRDVIDTLSKVLTNIDYAIELGRGAISNVLKTTTPNPTSHPQEEK